MNAHASRRTFDDQPAARARVPLLIGLMGPSGGGKTYSALRLARGIQQVAPGEIFYVDTEARRALHYADRFTFRHVEFAAPFGSLDYLAAIEHCVAKGASVVVVDSLSHEHEGIGGMLDFHERELDRLAGDDWGKREKMKMLAWQKPKQARQRLINTVLQINANFIFCFRAKEKIKPVRGGGVKEMGFMPIAGEEFVFEMTLNCLLLPKADGVPTWRSDEVGERLMIKLPEQFREMFADGRALDEQHGRALAEWARGGARPGAAAHLPAPTAPGPTAEDVAAYEADLDEQIRSATDGRALLTWWNETKDRRAGIPDGPRLAMQARVKDRADELKGARA